MPNLEVEKILTRDRTSHFVHQWSQKQNVIILIFESLASEYIGRGYTPYFDDLAKRGLLFNNFYANGRRSIEAIPSILSSIPSLLNDAFLTSSYQGIRLNGLGKLLTQQGYSTAFFHGAANGSMFFDSYTARLGFQRYFGLNEYPDRERDYDGFWGIFDEPFLTFVAQNLNQFKKPFAVVAFTLSAHQPYAIPEKYKNQFQKGSHNVLETIAYSDLALKTFFAEAEKQDWYKDTLFIITGDHTSINIDPDYATDLGRYRVPLLIYHPSVNSWPTHNLNRTAQHVDIMPTILDILSLQFAPQLLSRVGSSVFASEDEAFVVNRTPEGFWYLSRDVFIKLDSQHNLLESYKLGGPANSQASIINKATIESDEIKLHETRLKAYLQYFINGVIDNKLYIERQ